MELALLTLYHSCAWLELEYPIMKDSLITLAPGGLLKHLDKSPFWSISSFPSQVYIREVCSNPTLNMGKKVLPSW